MSNLYKNLIEYNAADIYPFCMPGHKRRFSVPGLENPYSADITEVEGFDDLHDPHGIIKAITDKAENIYDSPHSYISVNGSTACNLAAVSAIPEGGPILVAANCHRSVFNGAAINKRQVIELAPEWIGRAGIYGGISPANVENAFKGYPNIKGLVITSPTYEGFISDVEAIAETAHSHGALLIVDEAHGAHLPYSPDFPKSALAAGRRCGGKATEKSPDMVIQSLHKTVGSLNQTAWLHVLNEEPAPLAWEKLKMFMTTSPSYLLMASMEEAMDWSVSSEGKAAYKEYTERLFRYREAFKSLKNIWFIDNSLVGNYNIKDMDPSKLVFVCRQMTGRELLLTLLNEYHLQLEKCGDHYVVAMTSVFDTEEGFARLLAAMTSIDEIWQKSTF